MVRRPILRYHGGKWKLAPWIIANMPRHDVYVEPFGGGANVLLRKNRTSAEVYNDLDAAVVNVFSVLQDPVKAERLLELISLTPYARVEFDRTYETPTDDIEAARYTIMRSFMGHGTDSITRTCRTGFRAKMSDERAMPSAAWAAWPEPAKAFVVRLRGVVIEQRDALEVIERMDTNKTLFYCDPPYVVSTRSSLKNGNVATHGYRHELTDEGHRNLAKLLRNVHGMVMLSGYRCDLYDELYGDWLRLDCDTLADGARKRTESLWFNSAAAVRRPQPKLMMGQTEW